MAKSANKRIGILGGTFNPVHNGHLGIAKSALKKLHLDKVIFIPTYIPPHKKLQGNASAEDRLNMLRLAVGESKKFAICSCEISRKGKSYSVETAKTLKSRYGKRSKLFFLIGADGLKGLSKWKNILELRKIVQFAVFPRPGYKIKRINKDILRVNMTKRAVSSTEIRRYVKRNRKIKRFLPSKVLKYIIKSKLYR